MSFRLENTEQLKHLMEIKDYLVGLRRAAVNSWAETPETDRQPEKIADILGFQAQIDAIERAIRDES
jgi:hypothetical protein